MSPQDLWIIKQRIKSHSFSVVTRVWMRPLGGKAVSSNTWKVRPEKGAGAPDIPNMKSTPVLFLLEVQAVKVRRAYTSSSRLWLLNSPLQGPANVSFKQLNPWGSPLFLLAKNFSHFPTHMSTELAWSSPFPSSFRHPGVSFRERWNHKLQFLNDFLIPPIRKRVLCTWHGTRYTERMTEPARSSPQGFCSSLSHAKSLLPNAIPGSPNHSVKTLLSSNTSLS